jgi:hypothetical protein
MKTTYTNSMSRVSGDLEMGQLERSPKRCRCELIQDRR